MSVELQKNLDHEPVPRANNAEKGSSKPGIYKSEFADVMGKILGKAHNKEEAANDDPKPQELSDISKELVGYLNRNDLSSFRRNLIIWVARSGKVAQEVYERSEIQGALINFMSANLGSGDLEKIYDISEILKNYGNGTNLVRQVPNIDQLVKDNLSVARQSELIIKMRLFKQMGIFDDKAYAELRDRLTTPQQQLADGDFDFNPLGINEGTKAGEKIKKNIPDKSSSLGLADPPDVAPTAQIPRKSPGLLLQIRNWFRQ